MLRLHRSRVLMSFTRCTSAPKIKPQSPTCANIPQLHPAFSAVFTNPFIQIRSKSKSANTGLVDAHPTEIDIGAEITGVSKASWQRIKLLRCLTMFSKRDVVRNLAAENGINSSAFNAAYLRFKDYVVRSKILPADLHIALNDIMQDKGHIDDLFPFFMNYTREQDPLLDNLEDMKKISDLRNPASWYQEARQLRRKIFYHVGPTNSGKTYHALQRFLESKTGVYCGPLRLLAQEVFQKANNQGTPCDLLTGDDKRTAREDGVPADHVACTVEMAQLSKRYEVAVIDEIQMVRDQSRGYAWTRAFLGLCADEIHVCGEASALELIHDLAADCGDEVEIRDYSRLTSLTVLSHAIEDFSNIQKGDCLVCFSKKTIYEITKNLEKLGMPTAIIYGSLPASTKLAQAAMFNDPDHPTKVLVATDAVGLGLNLCIKRMILYSLDRRQKVAVEALAGEGSSGEGSSGEESSGEASAGEDLLGEELSDEESPPSGEGNKAKKIVKYQYMNEEIPAHHALQIAGRAGRFGTIFEKGYTTTFNKKELTRLRRLLNTPIERIERAGLGPTLEQIQMFSFYLPKASILEILEKFEEITELDNEKYFLCDTEAQKDIAKVLEDIPLPLRALYSYMLSPCDTSKHFHKVMIQMFARRHSTGKPLTFDFLCRAIDWPLKEPQTISDLMHLEAVFEVTDLYIWLGYRFSEMLPHEEQVRALQRELDLLIRDGISRINSLIREADKSLSDTEPVVASPDMDDSQQGKVRETDDISSDALLAYTEQQTEPELNSKSGPDSTQSALKKKKVPTATLR